MLPGVLGFLGFGNMGSAILQGLIESGVLTGKHTVVFDPDLARQEQARQLGARIAGSAVELAESSDIVLLAVKPQTMGDALHALAPALKPSPLIVSIAAGITIAWIQQRATPRARVARVMPNTPALCHAGAAGIALGPGCTEADGQTVRTIFEAVGIVEMVQEQELDAVTALSGSGPAYFFYMVECLVRAGIAAGLAAETASRLAGQTLLGAGMLLQQSGEAPETLRARVTSPGGTTEAALKRMEADHFDAVVRAAVQAAVERSRELGIVDS